MDILELSLGETGLIGLLNSTEELADLAALQSRAPDSPPEALALVASALGAPGYDAILVPADYEALTLKRVENEDPKMPWRPGVMRIRDFGMPDFAEIDVPRRDGDTLIYFARDIHTGLPYRVTLPLGTVGDADISPLALTPFDGDPVPVPDDITQAALGPNTAAEPRAKKQADNG